MVFEDLNVFHSQEECVNLDPVQQPNSEKEGDSVGEMMLLGKKIKSLVCSDWMLCSSASSQTFSRHYSHHLSICTHTRLIFVLSPLAEPAPAGGSHFPCILRAARVEWGELLLVSKPVANVVISNIQTENAGTLFLNPFCGFSAILPVGIF